MTLIEMLDTLDRNHVHGILLYNEKHCYYDEIVYLEGGTCMRHWLFDEDGYVLNTYYESAPNGEIDLLEEFALDINTYGIENVSWF